MSSPPRSPLPRREGSSSPPFGRKPSIVERTSAALENAFSRKASLTSSLLGSQSSTNLTIPEEPPYSMNSDDYEIGPIIGYGSSAIVHIAKYKPLDKNVAIKMIDLDMFERNQIDELRREIQIMSLSKHPNLLAVHGSFVHGSKLFIVTPFLSAGSCLDIMKTAYPEGMEEVAIATILKQALLGLEYLHRNGLIHRDVKAGNLLVADDGLVQLADFGVSNSLMEYGERKGLRKTFVGTPCWMAPEVMEQSGYDYKADIWSFGITGIELGTGHAPFAKYPPMKVLMLTLQNEPPTIDRDRTKFKYSKLFKEMIDSCLQKDPSKRPSAEKLLQHPFFKQAKKPAYLAASILQGLPAIAARPHNRRAKHMPKESAAQGESWDFDSHNPAEEDRHSHKVQFSESAASPDISSNDSITKKSRFKVDGSSEEGSQGASGLNESFNGNVPKVSSAEVKKGRFTVNDGSNTTTVTTPAPAESLTDSPDQSNASAEIQGDGRKGRFAVQQFESSPQGGAIPLPPLSTQLDLNASSSSLNMQQKASRFTVSKDNVVGSTTSGNSQSPLSGSLPRKSRFEVSSSDLNDQNVSPSSSLNRKTSKNTMEQSDISRHNSLKGNLEDKMENLQKSVESQAKLLNEIVSMISKHGVSVNTPLIQQAIQNQEQMKKDLEILKKE